MNSEVQEAINFDSELLQPAERVLYNYMDGDTQVVEFQGRTFWQSHDRQEPITFLDDEDIND